MDEQEIARRLFNPINNICGTSALNNDYDALWGCLGAGCIINFVICLVVYFLSDPILSLFFGGLYEKIKAERSYHALSMNIETVTLINSTITGGLVCFETYILHTLSKNESVDGFELPARPSLWLATGTLVGYFIWHLCITTYQRESVEKAMTETMGSSAYRVVRLYHICGIIFFPVSLRIGIGCYFVAMFIQSEITSVPLAFRTFGLRMGPPFDSSIWCNLATLTWIVSWVVFRLMPIPTMMNVLSTANLSEYDVLTYSMSWLCYVPIIVNVWWTWFIVKGVYKRFCGGNIDKKKI